MNTSGNEKNNIFIFLFLLFFLFNNCGPGSQKLIKQKYPEGFSLKHPKNWQAKVLDKTYIWASTKEEEQDSSFIFIYPFFLKKVTTSKLWLYQNLASLSNFFNKIKFEKTQQICNFPDETLVKFNFTRGHTSYKGMALCSIYEKSGILYVMGATEEDFESKRGNLVKILESFKFEETKTSKTKSPRVPALKYFTWQDPLEGAFSLDVPKGWKAEGGTFRRAAVDLVHFLTVTSPDQKIRIQFNDNNIPAFTSPCPMLSMAGFYEGSWYSPGYGVRLLVKRYTPGRYFLNEYLRSYYAPNLTNFELVSQKDRTDVAQKFNRIYSQFMAYGISFTLHAGEVAFRYKDNTQNFIGYGLALTQIVQSMGTQGAQWSVPLLVIYICPEPKAEMVHQISDRMFRSIKMNPQWVASQQQLTSNVSQIVSQTNQEISRIINDSYWTRQRTMDNINRRFSNYILGKTDVVDPDTGKKWKVEAGHNYYWRKDYTDQVIGTEVYERPDINFSPLREF